MTTETSQPARPHVNPNLSLSAHDTGWKLLSAGFSRRLVLVPVCVTKSRLFKLASYRIEPSGAGGRGSIVAKRQCVAQSSLLSAPFASLVDAVQPRRSTACWGWGLAQDRRRLGCALLTDGSRRSFGPSFRSVSSPSHTPGLTKAVYSLSRHGFTKTATHSKRDLDWLQAQAGHRFLHTSVSVVCHTASQTRLTLYRCSGYRSSSKISALL